MRAFSKYSIAACLLGGALFLGGCTDPSDYDFDASAQQAQDDIAKKHVAAIFDPANGKIPPTNNLLFAGSTDGTLNIPVLSSDSAGAQLLKSALNTLDGFSTVNPIVADFGAAIDPESIKPGESVHLFELGKDSNGNTVIASEVTALAGTVTGADNNRMALIPTAPLKGSTTYAVIITNQVKTAEGYPVVASQTYNASKGTASLVGSEFEALEPIRLITNQNEALAAARGIKPADIVLSWQFKTQSIGHVLSKLHDAATAGNFVAIPAQDTSTGTSIQLTTKNFLDPQNQNPNIIGKADVYLGALTVPYYLHAAANTHDQSPNAGFMSTATGAPLSPADDTPVKTADITIPVLITVPNAHSKGQGVAPAEGFPVVIFQHGITANRTSLLPIADALADAGFVGVAIDLVLHGVDPNGNAAAIHASNTPFPNDTELTFDLDLVNNQTGAPGPDGAADPSGQFFINLASLPTSRDNIRQSVSDLFVLRKSLGGLTSGLTGVTVPKLDANTVRFIGHSLGGIVGSVFLAYEDDVGAATLAMPGGGIAQLLNNSPTFGPRIAAGLAANGIEKGTPEFDTFMAAAQWIVDPADPVNHAAQAGTKHPIHMIEVVGGNSNPPDPVIPNSVATAPLSGTEPLARLMGLSPVKTPGSNNGGLVRFTAGNHSSILIPGADSADVTIEMQTETATFMATNGASLPITNTAVVQ